MDGADRAPLEVIAEAVLRERQRANLSASELARRAGIAKSTVSQLESGTGNPSIETLWAISTALGIPFSRLVDTPRSGVQLIRAGEGPGVGAAAANYHVTLLSASAPHARRDVYLISAQPGASRDSDPHSPGIVEHVVISRGSALVGPTADPIELHEGDYLSYPGDAPHTFRALAPDTMAVLVSEHV